MAGGDWETSLKHNSIFMEALAETKSPKLLQTLPGDDVRQIMWRFADRYEFHMLVQGARGVARSSRGPRYRRIGLG